MWELQNQGKWEKAGQTKKSEMALIRDDRSEGVSALTVTLASGVRIHSFSEAPAAKCHPPEGALYIFPRFYYGTR